MRHLLILAAAAFIAVGCARNEEETGAAPDQGDPAVTATDTTAVQTDSTMGAVPEPTVTDTTAVTTDTTTVSGEAEVGADSAAVEAEVPADTTAAYPADTTAVPADTTAQQ